MAACSCNGNQVLAESHAPDSAWPRGAHSHLQLHHERLELVLPLRLAGGKDVPWSSCAARSASNTGQVGTQGACCGWAEV